MGVFILQNSGERGAVIIPLRGGAMLVIPDASRSFYQELVEAYQDKKCRYLLTANACCRKDEVVAILFDLCERK